MPTACGLGAFGSHWSVCVSLKRFSRRSVAGAAVDVVVSSSE